MAQERSPYTPPAAVILEAVRYEEHPDAELGRRFVNYLLDAVGIQVASIPLGVALELMFPGSLVRTGPAILLGLVTFLLYYASFEYALGRTPAKMATGTRVITLDGAAPSLFSILGRTAARAVPFEPLSFFGKASPRGWHDTWSKTRVVNTRTRAEWLRSATAHARHRRSTRGWSSNK